MEWKQLAMIEFIVELHLFEFINFSQIRKEA